MSNNLALRLLLGAFSFPFSFDTCAYDTVGINCATRNAVRMPIVGYCSEEYAPFWAAICAASLRFLVL